MFKKYMKMLLMLFVIVCLQNSVAYANEPDDGMDVILVIDTSNSMNFKDSGRMALKVANYFVRWLPDEDLRLHVFNFSTNVNEIYRSSSVLGAHQDKVMIENAISSLKYDGETDIGSAMEECYRVWKEIKDDSKTRKQCIVFMTDGDIDFYKERGKEEREKLINTSRKRMEDVIGKIECPIYVVAFGDEAVNGKDANYIGSQPGNYIKYAKNGESLKEIYTSIANNLFLMKPNENRGVEIKPENNTYPLNNDKMQTGYDIEISNGVGGNGLIANGTTDIKVKNSDTGQVFSLEELDIVDYVSEWGRLIKLPQEVLREGALELVFDIASRDVIDIISYYHYDIEMKWDRAPKPAYFKEQDVKLSVELDGIPKDDFNIYAVLQKTGTQGIADNMIPFGQYNISEGTAIKEIELYGTQYEIGAENNYASQMLVVSGIKMRYDDKEDKYYCSISFPEEGEYQVYLYGENSRGFIRGENYDFVVDNREFIDYILTDISEWFMKLDLFFKVITVLSCLIIIYVIYRIITSPFRCIRRFIRRHKIRKDEKNEGV